MPSEPPGLLLASSWHNHLLQYNSLNFHNKPNNMLQVNQLQNWYEEVWHKGNEEAIDQLLHKDAIIHGLGTETNTTGPDNFKPFYKSFRESFTSVHVNLQPIVVTDDIEAAYCDVTGKDTDGKKFRFHGITIARFKDGKLVEGWNGFDFLTMYKQLGYELIPPNA